MVSARLSAKRASTAKKKSTPKSAKRRNPVTTSVVKQDDPIGTATVTCSSLNVRKGPGTSFERIGGLTNGKSIQVYADEGDWLKIGYGSGFGYVAQKYTSYQDAQPPVVQDPGNQNEGKEEDKKRTGVVVGISSYLNVRSGPGTGHESIGQLHNGDNVVILGEENGWYKIEYNGGVGYVSGQYVNETTGGNTNPGNQQGENGGGGGINPSKGTIDYKQFDSRWGSKLYTSTGNKSQTYASSACGPTASADVIWALKDSSVTPVTIGEMAVAKGYRTKDNGTAWGLFPYLGKHYGLSCTETSSMDTLKNKLANGALAVCSMGPGYWTSGGHFICVWKYDGSTVYANDPGSNNRKSQNGKDFKSQMKNMWIYQ